MDDALRILEGAKALLDRGWNQNNFAQNAAGEPVQPEEGSACSWCLTGALARAAQNIGVSARVLPYRAALKALQEAVPFRARGGFKDFDAVTDLTAFNDFFTRTADEVIALVDAAITRVETEAKSWVTH